MLFTNVDSVSKTNPDNKAITDILNNTDTVIDNSDDNALANASYNDNPASVSFTVTMNSIDCHNTSYSLSIILLILGLSFSYFKFYLFAVLSSNDDISAPSLGHHLCLLSSA